jgi:hypothetical protein
LQNQYSPDNGASPHHSFTRKFLMQSIQNRLCLPQTPLCPGRLFVFIREPLRLLTVCFFRTDPTLPPIFIAETSCPILRFRMSPNAGHPITILITYSAIQALGLFFSRLGESPTSQRVHCIMSGYARFNHWRPIQAFKRSNYVGTFGRSAGSRSPSSLLGDLRLCNSAASSKPAPEAVFGYRAWLQIPGTLDRS